MKPFFYRGKRIKPSDKSLVYHFALFSLLPIFLLVMFLFYAKTLIQMDWNNLHLLDSNIQLNIPYLVSSLATAFFVCLLLGLLYYRYRIDHIKQLEHRQKLARMILENGWYESEQIQSEGFFKDRSVRVR